MDVPFKRVGARRQQGTMEGKEKEDVATSKATTPRYHTNQGKMQKNKPDKRKGNGGNFHHGAVKPRPSTASGTIATNDDFVALAPSSEDEQDTLHNSERAATNDNSPVSGKKRKAEEISRDDGYASKKLHEQADLRKTPWASSVNWNGLNNVAEMLHAEIRAFVKYISPTPEEHAVRELIIRVIFNAIRSQWPDAIVSPFGSFETKLYLPTGDIDLVIQSDMMAYSNRARVLTNIAAVLRKARIATQVQVISKAKVPIVKFISSIGRLPVDISINQMNGLTACRIINSFMAHLPALKPLVLVVKSFLSQRGQNEVYSGGLGSYTVVCMVISFIQMHPKIRQGEIDPSENLGVLLMEFFEFYGRYFNYEQTGISLLGGGLYFNKMQRGWNDQAKPFLLCVEDPQDPSNDIGRNSHAIVRVRKTLAGAYEVLMNRLFSRHEDLSTKTGGRRKRFDQENSKPENVSLLVAVMGVTPETISHRRDLFEIYRSGTLQRQLNMLPESYYQWTTQPRPAFHVESRLSRNGVPAMHGVNQGRIPIASSSDDDEYVTQVGVGSEDQDSRYTIMKERGLYVADSDQDGNSEDYDDQGDVPTQVLGSGRAAPKLNRSGSTIIQIDRKKAYWAAKSAPETTD